MRGRNHESEGEPSQSSGSEGTLPKTGREGRTEAEGSQRAARWGNNHFPPLWTGRQPLCLQQPPGTCLLHSLGADHANPLGRAAANMGTFLWLLLLSLLREGERDCSWGQPGLPPALFCWTSAGKPCPLGWNASALLEVSVA